MEKLRELLMQAELYPCQKAYVGCSARKDVHFEDCPADNQKRRIKDISFVLGDCEEE